MLPGQAVEPPENASTEVFRELLGKAALSSVSYRDYCSNYDIGLKPRTEIVIDAKDYVRAEGMEVLEYIDYQDMEGTSVFTDEKGIIEYEVDIQQEGFYSLSLQYYPVEGKSASIQRSILIDGALPYAQLGLVEFSRIWVNAVDEWERDNRGNDLKPRQVEAPQWVRSYCYDSEGSETEKLSVFLTKGVHTITLYSRREPMLLRRIFLDNPGEPQGYSTVVAQQKADGATDSSQQLITIQAEQAN